MKANVIKKHNITLHGTLRDHNIILRPLSDNDLPLLYKWNRDPEVIYWNEGSNANAANNDDENVQSIYKETSNAGYCFIIEFDGMAIGECLLCKMSVSYILEIYPVSADVRRIDILIGEKTFWNIGIGSVIVQMLVNFAFNYEKADIIYGITGDHNKRSARVFQKNGFHLFLECSTNNNPKEDGLELHYRLIRDEYKDR
ncbi:MAG: GNAT family N-acetyltransferase [Erysipelotrichales bacterium]|nr:GNAT family N-acetyltransferase [Erysipelotrichales bacterium]